MLKGVHLPDISRVQGFQHGIADEVVILAQGLCQGLVVCVMGSRFAVVLTL